MNQKFDVILLEEVWELFDILDEKTKIIYNIFYRITMILNK